MFLLCSAMWAVRIRSNASSESQYERAWATRDRTYGLRHVWFCAWYEVYKLENTKSWLAVAIASTFGGKKYKLRSKHCLFIDNFVIKFFIFSELPAFFRFFILFRCNIIKIMCNSLILLIICSAFGVFVVFGNVNDYEITCKDENGKNVDWLVWSILQNLIFSIKKIFQWFFTNRYYLYKLPGQFDGATKDKKSMYLFISSNSPETNWTLSGHTLNDLDSFAGQTLSQAYYDLDVVNHTRLLIAYNDEPPNRKSNSNKGHLKGVIVADERSGFWLIHSVPLYPNISSEWFSVLKCNNLIEWD